jgi:hypothetical protein
MGKSVAASGAARMKKSAMKEIRKSNRRKEPSIDGII